MTANILRPPVKRPTMTTVSKPVVTEAATVEVTEAATTETTLRVTASMATATTAGIAATATTGAIMQTTLGVPKGCSGQSFMAGSSCETYRQCVLGSFVELKCISGLHWNAEVNTCDWPANAKCRIDAGEIK